MNSSRGADSLLQAARYSPYNKPAPKGDSDPNYYTGPMSHLTPTYTGGPTYRSKRNSRNKPHKDESVFSKGLHGAEHSISGAVNTIHNKAKQGLNTVENGIKGLGNDLKNGLDGFAGGLEKVLFFGAVGVAVLIYYSSKKVDNFQQFGQNLIKDNAPELIRLGENFIPKVSMQV